VLTRKTGARPTLRAVGQLFSLVSGECTYVVVPDVAGSVALQRSSCRRPHSPPSNDHQSGVARGVEAMALTGFHAFTVVHFPGEVGPSRRTRACAPPPPAVPAPRPRGAPARATDPTVGERDTACPSTSGTPLRTSVIGGVHTTKWRRSAIAPPRIDADERTRRTTTRRATVRVQRNARWDAERHRGWRDTGAEAGRAAVTARRRLTARTMSLARRRGGWWRSEGRAPAASATADRLSLTSSRRHRLDRTPQPAPPRPHRANTTRAIDGRVPPPPTSFPFPTSRRRCRPHPDSVFRPPSQSP